MIYTYSSIDDQALTECRKKTAVGRKQPFVSLCMLDTVLLQLQLPATRYLARRSIGQLAQHRFMDRLGRDPLGNDTFGLAFPSVPSSTQYSIYYIYIQHECYLGPFNIDLPTLLTPGSPSQVTHQCTTQGTCSQNLESLAAPSRTKFFTARKECSSNSFNTEWIPETTGAESGKSKHGTFNLTQRTHGWKLKQEKIRQDDLVECVRKQNVIGL